MTRIASILLLSALLVGCQNTPNDTFPPLPMAGPIQLEASAAEPQPIVLPPSPKTVRLTWDYQRTNETPDMVFNVRHALELGRAPIRDWAVLTNVPGSERQVILPAFKPQEFFTVTASNAWGESDP